MVKKISLLIVFSVVLLLSSDTVFAENKTKNATCIPSTDTCIDTGDACQDSGVKDARTGATIYQCLPLSPVTSVFGKIKPPGAIQKFIDTLGTTDPTGAAGIGKFLSNLITLIYIFAIIVLIFMLLWGAFDWMLSEGNKEKLQAAQNKIINAIIGILLFAVAFAIIQILSQFTGFTFFV